VLWNYYFIEPRHTLTISELDNIVALGIFVAVALSVAWVVDLAARRSAQAARSRAESETLSLLAGSVLRGERALPALLERVRETFAVDTVALLERQDDYGPWSCVDSVGEGAPCIRPDEADVDIPVNEHLSLVLRGRVLPAADRRVLSAFAVQAAVVLERQRLVGEAAAARRQAEANKIRTALLAAVSHDLRTPLAGIKASVSSLRSEDVAWSPEDEAELLAGIEEGADRLDNLVGNLLDMSRLHTETLVPLMRDVSLDEVVPAALRGLPPGSVELKFDETLPPVRADAGLLERVVANVVENAVKYGATEDSPVRIKAGVVGDRLELRVVDSGPGVQDADKQQVFEPFQRLGDAPRGVGVGLGLAVARGFAEAMGGELQAEDTPGGGLTMVLALRTAEGSAHVVPEITEGAVT
jgi:two-component system sensor histidine kinase KdpD